MTQADTPLTSVFSVVDATIDSKFFSTCAPVSSFLELHGKIVTRQDAVSSDDIALRGSDNTRGKVLNKFLRGTPAGVEDRAILGVKKG